MGVAVAPALRPLGGCYLLAGFLLEGELRGPSQGCHPGRPGHVRAVGCRVPGHPGAESGGDQVMKAALPQGHLTVSRNPGLSSRQNRASMLVPGLRV